MLFPESVSFVSSAILTVGETGEIVRESGAGEILRERGAGEILRERGAGERLRVNEAGEILCGGVGDFSKVAV